MWLNTLALHIYIAVWAFTLLWFIAEITSTRLQDYIDPRRWRSFYIWLMKLQLKKMGETNTYLTQAELIQQAYRVAKCFECIKRGECVHCGCHTEGRMNNKTEECSAGKWFQHLEHKDLFDYLNSPDCKLKFEIHE